MALTRRSASTGVAHQVDPSQILRASTALLRKIQSDRTLQTTTASKSDLLADADADEDEDDVPIWLILTTKKHIVDKKRLKPGKIVLPHPYLNTADPSLRICLITADPQRAYKDLIAHPTFPLDVSKRIARVIGLTKLKAEYKSYEARRQLLGEYDIFLADDRIITYLPGVLGKPFYKSGSKRPVPINLQGKRQNFDEQGNKRRKLAEGGTKVVKSDVDPAAVAKEVERALASTLVHLAPSTTTSVKVGLASMKPEALRENVETVMAALVDKYVPQKWPNVRAVHMKGPTTAALPIYMTDALWEDEKDVLDEAPSTVNPGKKRKAGALSGAGEVIEVPGPDGKMRRVEPKAKKGKSDGREGEGKAEERAEAEARREKLRNLKDVAKAKVNGDAKATSDMPVSKAKAKAAI